jgi:hypothetical protein
MFATFMAVALAAPLHFDCAGPITPNMSAQAILARYGKDARRGMVSGDDVLGVAAKPIKGIILYPDDPSRRLEITFWDDAQTAVERVTAGAKSVAWTGPLGLHPGSTVDEAREANGHDFTFTGLGWIYGGYVTHGGGGKLGQLDAGCAVQVRFALPAGTRIPGALEGEQDLDTTMPAVKAADLRIDRLSIDWPLPAGVRMSGGS